VNAETEGLVHYLNQQRAAVSEIVDGLPETALRRAVFPSGWTCLGLINHLAVDDERYWFRGVAAGRDRQPEMDHPAHDRGNRPARRAPRHRAGDSRRPHRPRLTGTGPALATAGAG
jgi:Protein of unknown function (DUF664)